MALQHGVVIRLLALRTVTLLAMYAPMRHDPIRQRLSDLYLAPEGPLVERLIAEARLSPAQRDKTAALARQLVAEVRANKHERGTLDAFLQEYSLTSEEGVALMCLAEAFLRVPDADTADLLIKDKIGGADWRAHRGKSDSMFVNASTWGLMLTGRIVSWGDADKRLGATLRRLVQRSGEPVIRQSVAYAMKIMGGQFVLGRTIREALSRARDSEKRGFRHSFDMLGEAAYTRADAARYLQSYRDAMGEIARAAGPRGADSAITARPSISIKLSALHPRYEWVQRDQVMRDLLPQLVELARSAKASFIGLTIDAEEADRLDLMLDLIEALALHPDLAGWDGLGLAVQAYQKRATSVVDWLIDLAHRARRNIPVRLVKGAYWDSEVKRAQEQGLSGYPVFTRKAATDVSYIACAKRLLSAPQAIYPQFATHNAHTLAAVRTLAEGNETGGNPQRYEFQRLHGMGVALYDRVVGPDRMGEACRIYAPVGTHEDLLAYLVRRLLENGANTSFVNRLADEDAPIDAIIADPIEHLAMTDPKPHPKIPEPRAIYAPRKASKGIVLSDPAQSAPLLTAMAESLKTAQVAAPIVDGVACKGVAQEVRDPADRRRVVGSVVLATREDADKAVGIAAAHQDAWDRLGGEKRATILEKAADLMEARMAHLMALCVREAGKSVPNAQADVREAIDFLRYYAAEARAHFSVAMEMPGPTGERNELSLHGRGVFACIAPWNFPVAIFTGQVAAALAAGNSVIAKPAEQTPLAAAAIIRLMHEAGVPAGVLHFLPGEGSEVGAALVSNPLVAGVAFTGSTETARIISRTLANREGPIATLIAETGGQNAMIVDSTALPEQVVRDVLASAFDSAGQRCSALRVLFLQEDIAPRVLDLLGGAMDDLVIADPMALSTDIGPVIDAAALAMLNAHAARMDKEGKLIRAARLSPGTEHGHFFAPRAYAIPSLSVLTREVFGPILHVITWKAGELAQVCDQINATGYGLTLGVHTRIEETAAFVAGRVRVGNLYVNRNQIGAVVGVQPFGGEGLSGTGPKAGGPHYLPRFAVERTLTTNTTASGGNASLLSLGEQG